jgi:large subunit ribosomal protein L16
MKGLYRNRNNKNSKIVYGSFGLKSLENGLISIKHLESARKVLSRRLKKIAKIWIRIKPMVPITAKVGDKRMGKGKGEVISRVFKIRCGMILFEVEGTNSQTIVELLKKSGKKIPIKLKIVILNNN